MTDQEIVRLVAEKIMEWIPRWSVSGEEFTGKRILHWTEAEAVSDMNAREKKGRSRPGFKSPSLKMRLVYCDGKGKITVFNPLTSDADACAVLDRMAEKGYDVDLNFSYQFQKWAMRYIKGDEPPPMPENLACYIDEDRRRAVCLAALKAVGVKLA